MQSYPAGRLRPPFLFALHKVELCRVTTWNPPPGTVIGIFSRHSKPLLLITREEQHRRADQAEEERERKGYQSMKGTVSHELAVAAPAADVWATYGSLQLGQLAPKLIPEFIEKFEVVEGDGGEGTVVRVTLPPSGQTFEERFVRIDDEELVKEVETIKGGFLDFGFRFYRVRFQIVGQGAEACVIRSSIDYDVGEGSEQNAALVTTDALAALAEAFRKYLAQKTPA